MTLLSPVLHGLTWVENEGMLEALASGRRPLSIEFSPKNACKRQIATRLTHAGRKKS